LLALYIILGILLFLFLLTLFNVYIFAVYDNELFLDIKIAFVKIKILPPKPEKKKPEKKPKKKKKPEEEPKKKKAKKENKAFSYVKQKGVSGILNIVKRISKLATGVLKDLFKRITVDKLNVRISVAGETAEDTAVKYGRLCSVFFPALRLITEIVTVKDYNVNVNPDFSQDGETSAQGEVEARIRILSLLTIVFKRGFEALRLFIKAKPQKRKNKKARASARPPFS
jgi:hypothetical protein